MAIQLLLISEMKKDEKERERCVEIPNSLT